MEDDLNHSDANTQTVQSPTGLRTANLKRSRHRATLACDTCRSRRTKCDGQKPSCTFCEEHDIPCIYQQVAPPGPSKHDQEMSAIRERLDHICSLLSVRLFDGSSSTIAGASQPLFDSYPIDESIISRNWRMEFPFMTVQTPSTMILLGLSPNLAAQLVRMERTEVSSLSAPNILEDYEMDYRSAMGAFLAFCDKIHHWYPIFNDRIYYIYDKVFTGDLRPSSDSCLGLLLAAIGSVAMCPSITTAVNEQPDAQYIRRALCMLPNVQFEFSLKSVQCLILFSIYYKCLARPCQAHDYALMASCKAQALFKCHFYDDDAEQLELLRRSFWSVLLIESELAYHIDMPESNIWKFDDRILLPDIKDFWHPIDNIRRETVISSTPPVPQDAAKAYFLAEIAMCRMLRRCTTSVTKSYDQEVYAPIIAVELTNQLERWYEHLPLSIRFERTILDPTSLLNQDNTTPQSDLTTVIRYLQTQYHLCLTFIYWPAVYSVIRAGASTPSLLSDCARFYNAYINFTMNAAVVIPCCPINAWYIHASLFIITMSAIEGARAPTLHVNVTPNVLRCFAIAAEAFDVSEVVAVSPSLRALRIILRERVGSSA